MREIPHADLAVAAWANGGGVTREISAEQDSDGIVWRISLADIDAEGPFSRFAGLHRILTVIAGDGMILETPSGPLFAHPLVPVSFAGAQQVVGRLRGGPTRALNVIFRPECIRAEVTLRTGPAEIAPADAPGVIFVVSGDARIGERMLSPLSTLIGAGEPIVLGPGAQALRITLERKHP